MFEKPDNARELILVELVNGKWVKASLKQKNIIAINNLGQVKVFKELPTTITLSHYTAKLIEPLLDHLLRDLRYLPKDTTPSKIEHFLLNEQIKVDDFEWLVATLAYKFSLGFNLYELPGYREAYELV